MEMVGYQAILEIKAIRMLKVLLMVMVEQAAVLLVE